MYPYIFFIFFVICFIIFDQVLQSENPSSSRHNTVPIDTNYIENRDRDFRLIVDSLCPLVDRFGRILTDLSPLLRALSSSSAPPLSSLPSTDSNLFWGMGQGQGQGQGQNQNQNQQNIIPGDYFPAPEHPSNNMLEISLASLLRPR